jgi:flavin-dependent dehydrogenase
MDFDVIVIGGGPAGLSAAWKCTERGLTTLVIEKKHRIDENKRANTCYLHIAPGMYGENISLRRTPGESRLVFQENGFSLRYTGEQFDYYDSYMLSPSGHRVHYCGNNQPLGTVFNMDAILSDLLREASGRGAGFMTSALVVSGENRGDRARVKVKKAGKSLMVEGRKILVCEGLSSRVVESLGLNKKREWLGKAPFLQYTMEGIDCPLEPGPISIRGSRRIIMAPDATKKNRWSLITSSTLPAKGCKTNVDYFLSESIISPWFKKAYPVKKLATTVEIFTPLLEPYKEHFLIVGESAGCAETQVHGAMLCGVWAGDAVYEELSNGGGFKGYQKKWVESFHWCREKWRHALVKHSIIYPYFSDAELDYLFSLLDGQVVVTGPSNPFTGMENLMNLFLAQPGIEKEMAQKVERFKHLESEDIKELRQKRLKRQL